MTINNRILNQTYHYLYYSMVSVHSAKKDYCHNAIPCYDIGGEAQDERPDENADFLSGPLAPFLLLQ